MPSEARQKKIMEKLNRAQKCSILGPQNLGSGGGPGPPGPPLDPHLELSTSELITNVANRKQLHGDQFSNNQSEACLCFYRPQGNVFTPVCHSVHRGTGSAQPLQMQTPQGWADPPRCRPPRCRPCRVEQIPLDADPPDTDPPGLCRPPWMQTPAIRSTSGQYASYWNAYLLA